MIDVLSQTAACLPHDLDRELGRLRQLVSQDQQLTAAVRADINRQRRIRLEIGDALLVIDPAEGEGTATSAWARAAGMVGLATATARTYRKVARRVAPAVRKAIDALDVEISYSTLRAAASMPKAENGDVKGVLERRLDQLVGMAAAVAGTDAPVVTETGLRALLGDSLPPVSVPADRSDGIRADEEGTTGLAPRVVPPGPDVVKAAIGADAEVARSACAALLESSTGRAEVLERVASTPEYLSELIADDRVRRTIQSQIVPPTRPERDPDDAAMDAAAEADPEVVLARWRAALQRHDAQATRLLEYDPAEIAARGDEELIDAVLTTAQLYSEWGQRLAAAARREGPRAG
ncbi:hypothetical protein ACFVXH_39825 [Kitasatospora sp. NPDC058184]|uniref:hypothetical protein n=1 Tax=Kitasatospora sp. NPDC058184 TaxID=3346370 RepID=UPI0036DE19A7